mmetsp:Transcript_38900/g.108231  ORF Transcript_38900/g.108231 Transcript_38900/m.108231 type:complete len:207 (-) Transcript_38900:2-622(-)
MRFCPATPKGIGARAVARASALTAIRVAAGHSPVWALVRALSSEGVGGNCISALSAGCARDAQTPVQPSLSCCSREENAREAYARGPWQCCKRLHRAAKAGREQTCEEAGTGAGFGGSAGRAGRQLVAAAGQCGAPAPREASAPVELPGSRRASRGTQGPPQVGQALSARFRSCPSGRRQAEGGRLALPMAWATVSTSARTCTLCI